MIERTGSTIERTGSTIGKIEPKFESAATDHAPVGSAQNFSKPLTGPTPIGSLADGTNGDSTNESGVESLKTETNGSLGGDDASSSASSSNDDAVPAAEDAVVDAVKNFGAADNADAGLDGAAPDESEAGVWRCEICETDQSPWICIFCGVIGCGRYVNAHAKTHFEGKMNDMHLLRCHRLQPLRQCSCQDPF